MIRVVERADDAVRDIKDGSTILVGHFGMAPMPALSRGADPPGCEHLIVVGNNAGNGHTGLAALLRAGRVRKMVCAFPRQSDSWVFDGLHREGRLNSSWVPQGNLAERLRAAG